MLHPPDSPTGDEWIGISAAASIAGLHRSTIHRRLARGEIPYQTVAGRRLISRAWANAAARDDHR